MPNNLYLKSSSIGAKVPTTSTLSLRELAVNTADGKIYVRQGTGVAGDKIYTVNPWNQSVSTISGGTYDLSFTSGNILIGSSTVTGTSSQPLQITGGTYISGNLGVNVINPLDSITTLGRIQIQQDAGSNNCLVLRGTSGSSYRWSIDNYQSSNTFRIFREDDETSANGFVGLSISPTGTVTATKFSGDGSLLTGIVAQGSGIQVQNNGSNIGTAATINFSTNLNATFSSGTVTVTASGGTYGGYIGVDLLEAMLFV